MALLVAGLVAGPAVPASAVVGIDQVSVDPVGGAEPTGQVIVTLDRLATEARRESVADVVDGRAGDVLADETFVVEVAPGQEDEAVERLADDHRVALVEPDRVVHAFDLTPNDPCVTSCAGGLVQSELQTIRAPAGWAVTTGSPAVRIAVLDTGVDAYHQDFLDQAGNSKVVASANFTNRTCTAYDATFHGTAVASIAAASTNNGVGMAGVGWSSVLLTGRVLDDCGSGYESDVIGGISWAVDQGADVINLSLGQCGRSSSLDAIIATARAAGVVVVAAAGNGSCSGGSIGTPETTYPAASPGVIAVGATTTGDQLASFSRWGNWVDMAAPGAGVVAANRSNNNYFTVSGTSFSAPMVAGAAALILALHPSDTPDAVEARLVRSARITADSGIYYATGVLDVGAALTLEPDGYWLVASDGGIFAFGDAQFYGSTGGIRLNQPIVGMAATASGQGYWLVASDGGIFAYGDAQFYGSTGSIRLNRPVVGMAPTASGNGYWLVASDGGIFAFGDAQFYGSTGSLVLNQPISGLAPTDDGGGYWMVASDGGIFAFGDAAFAGSNPWAGAAAVGIDGMAGSTLGYRIARADGTVEVYGSASYAGQLGVAPAAPVVDIEPTQAGAGYWLVGTDGAVYSFGDAYSYGSTAGIALNLPVVGMARR